jgi:YVTN family beta-propeller protein
MRRSLSLLLLFASPAFSATLLVLNKQDSTLSFIDPATGTTSLSIPTGASPHEVEVTADGATAVVSNYGGQSAGNSLTVVDIATRRERQRVDLGDMRRPHGLAVAGQLVFFTAEDARQIGLFDTTSGGVTWRFPTNQDRTHMIAASRDGRLLFTTNMDSSTASIIQRQSASPAGDAMQTVVPVGRNPEGMDVTPDGRQLWTANAGDGGISIVDVASRKLVKSFPIGTQRSNRLKFTPDGKLALVSDLGKGELVVVDVATQSVKTRLPVGQGASGILVVPDGSRAYVAAASERRLAVVDLGTLTISGHVATGGGPDGMAWVR